MSKWESFYLPLGRMHHYLVVFLNACYSIKLGVKQNLYKVTYSIEQLHRGDRTDEDSSETSKTSFNEDQVWTQETWNHKTQVLLRFVSP